MPIYDLGYRHWSGAWTSHPYRWWVITRQGIQLLVHKKRFTALLLLSLIPFLVRSVMLYLSSAVGRNIPLLQINAKFFEDFLSQQMFFVFIIATYAGAGLVANDLKANALQIYLSKPITRQDYLMGKLGVLVFFLTLPTLVPAVLLYLLAILFQTNLSYFRDNPWVLASIVGYSLAIIFTYSLIMLALSSLTRSSRFAGISFAAVFLFSQILYGILSGILRTSKVAWVSLGNNLTQVGDFLFRGTAHFGSPTWLSAVILLALMAGSAWVVHNRVKAVEVVS
ncbi:MAG TPA: ABC transporter permease subunit [Acidobacteriota bacterium]|nr:ABC transporter permease subunit [Acidobacteriota bacterium]